MWGQLGSEPHIPVRAITVTGLRRIATWTDALQIRAHVTQRDMLCIATHLTKLMLWCALNSGTETFGISGALKLGRLKVGMLKPGEATLGAAASMIGGLPASSCNASSAGAEAPMLGSEKLKPCFGACLGTGALLEPCA